MTVKVKEQEPTALDRIVGMMPFGDLRALTLWQPMAGAIAHLGKDFENRPTMPPENLLGQPLAIHAGMHYEPVHGAYIVERGLATRDQVEGACRVHGAIIAIVRLCSRWSFDGAVATGQSARTRTRSSIDTLREIEPAQWRWYMQGTKAGFHVDCVVPLDPIPCLGMQGYWRVGDYQKADIAKQLVRKYNESAST